MAWCGEVSSLEVSPVFLGTGGLGSTQGAPLTCSSARQIVAAGHCWPGLMFVKAKAGDMGLGPDVPAPLPMVPFVRRVPPSSI